MGRFINANLVGRNGEDRMVHKFWVAIQPSDVSDYLDTYAVADEPEEWAFARLKTDHAAAITATVAALKGRLQRRFGTTYREVRAAEATGQWSDVDAVYRHHDLLELASRIDLGEHLLQTIEQMKHHGIAEQELLIELL